MRVSGADAFRLWFVSGVFVLGRPHCFCPVLLGFFPAVQADLRVFGISCHFVTSREELEVYLEELSGWR